jgi:hypothetical protein
MPQASLSGLVTIPRVGFNPADHHQINDDEDRAGVVAIRIFGSFEPAIRLERFVEQDHIRCDCIIRY